MNIQEIIYDTTRGLFDLSDKLSIATIFIFCDKISTKTFSNLLYTKNPKRFIKSLEKDWSNYDVSLKIDFQRDEVLKAFNSTRDAVISKYDKDGFYKAVFEKDPFAMVICDISSKVFSKKEFDNLISKTFVY